MLEAWRITKNDDTCTKCEEAFPHNRTFYSCLVETPEGLARRDFCPSCWEGRQDAARAPGGLDAFCFWRTRRAPQQQKQIVNTELMMEFFDRLKDGAGSGGTVGEQKKAFRFVLALYLMRRKELKLIEISHQGGALIFERKSSSDRVEVADPGLTEEQIQEAAGQLTSLLNAGLTTQASPSVEAA